MIKRKFVIGYLFPLLTFVGKILPSLRTRIESRIIAINNRLVRRHYSKGKKPSSVLLLLPHCLQLDSCPHKITSNILNCKECGACDIASILTIEKEYGIIIKVATGGRLAKKWVEESGAELIVAVACERELIEGIIGLGALAPYVWAIENYRPYGPCINTRVDITRLKSALEDFIKGTVEK